MFPKYPEWIGMVSSSSPSLLAVDKESYSDAAEAGNQASAFDSERLISSIHSSIWKMSQ
jgi:hypothetical protein